MKALLALLLLSAVASAETLPNGLRVIVDPDPTVNSIGVYVRHDDCAAALAQPEHIDDELDKIDGFATASFETTHFDAYTQVPAGALELALWFEAKRMRSPVLAPDAPAPDDDYSKIDAAIETALRPHTTVDKNEPQRCVAPEHTTIAIVGRVDAAAAQKLARKYFAALARSRFGAREWKSTLVGTKSITLQGVTRHVRAWSVPNDSEATAMLLARRLATYGIEAEVRDEQFRISGNLSQWVSVDGDLSFEKRLIDTELLTKLESLRYRASVLASSKSIAKLRADIASLTTEDMGAFTALLDKTPALDIEVKP